MGAQTIVPASREEWLAARARDITSTEVAALFNCSPYLTAFELWHRKRNETIVEIEENARMLWGTRLQRSIAEGIAEDNGWIVRSMPEYMRDPDLRIGASFDFAIEPDGILEIKNVDSLIFKEGWLVEGDEIEAPPHIELQIQHQLLVSGRRFAKLGALIGGNRVVLSHKEPLADVQKAIRDRVQAFWKSVDAGKEPAPDLARDARFVSSLYQFAEPGKVINATAEVAALAVQYKLEQESERKAKERKDALKAAMILKIGDAEKVVGDGITITAGVVGECPISYVRPAYRDFRVFVKKAKETKA